MMNAEVTKALETLKSYDWGDDREALKPIDEAIIATHGDAGERKTLEKGLVDVLAGGISRSAQDYVCRKLRVVGTGESVAALAALLADERTSHIARYALERIPDEKAAAALREALPTVSNKLRPGLIGSLGARRDTKSIKAIAGYLGDADVNVVRAAAHALALIGSPAAGRTLRTFGKQASGEMKMFVGDACLVCAERLTADGKRGEAMVLYRELRDSTQPTRIKTAAMKGMLGATSGG